MQQIHTGKGAALLTGKPDEQKTPRSFQPCRPSSGAVLIYASVMLMGVSFPAVSTACP